ncbi:MAG: HAMP domain-containing histidine kinase [Anaerolineae bacterium]|nr:HAMP domain-containing histidine kinase [Anaerolineae bacterium]
MMDAQQEGQAKLHTDNILELLQFLNQLNNTEEDYARFWHRIQVLFNLDIWLVNFANYHLDEEINICFGEDSECKERAYQQLRRLQVLVDKESRIDGDTIEKVGGNDYYEYAIAERVSRTEIGMVYTRKGSHFSPVEKQLFQLIFSITNTKIRASIYEYIENELNSIQNERLSQYNFISGITHDLRNPLGCIKGYVTTLLRDDVQWEVQVQKQFLEVINTETDHLEGMITNLLETSRLQSGTYELKYENVDLYVILEQVKSSNEIRHPEMDVHIFAQDRPAFIFADQKKLTQAILNLVENAWKHAKSLEIWFKIRKENNGFWIEVEDRGEGIPVERLNTIFERFSRTPEFSPGNHGVGLGLYISKQIIERHQGSIQVSSTPGEGTTFSIFIPKAPTQKLMKERG